MNEKKTIQKYIEMLEEFLEGDLSASAFSNRYLEEFKSEDPGLSEETYQILQDLFAEADAYCEPEIRDDVRGSIGEAELQDAATRAVTSLEKKFRSLDR